MNAKTKSIAIGGMMTALALVLLLIASVAPGGRLVLTALSGVVGAVVIARCGLGIGALSWIAVSLLGLLLLPTKGCVLLYAVFFGPYTLLKNRIERLNNRQLEWVLKLAFCLVISAALFYLSSAVLGLFPTVLAQHVEFFLPAVAVAFVIYDIVFSKLIYAILSRLPL